MPNWFAKTKEMAAFDRHFSLIDIDEGQLRDRYLQALSRVRTDPYYDRSDALETQWANRPNRDRDLQLSLDGHFRGDWVHHLFPSDPGTYGKLGGRFWPQVPSIDVIERLRAGLVFAFHKALGDSELASLGLPEHYRDRLWKAERENEIPIDDGIRPSVMSWNCVAPAGENFFEVDALRGPTVVEFAVATPRPFGHGTVMGIADDLRDGVLPLDEGGDSAS
jgi:hypothetical protein